MAPRAAGAKEVEGANAEVDWESPKRTAEVATESFIVVLLGGYGCVLKRILPKQMSEEGGDLRMKDFAAVTFARPPAIGL